VTGRDAAHRGVWPRHLADHGELPEFSDLHSHVIPLAVGFYRRGLGRAENPASLADTLFTEPVPYSGCEFSSPLKSITGGNSLVPCWAKPLDDSTWILRLHEVLGRRGAVTIHTAPGWSLERTDLGETPHGPLENGQLAFSPHEVLSVRFRRD
jgi:alpha-mannosidase